MEKMYSKMLCLIAVGVLDIPNIYAQRSTKATGIEVINNVIIGYVKPIFALIYVVWLILACVGIFKVYSMWNSEDPNTVIKAISWFVPLIFVLAAIITIQINLFGG